jgi:hypothetical protein
MTVRARCQVVLGAGGRRVAVDLDSGEPLEVLPPEQAAHRPVGTAHDLDQIPVADVLQRGGDDGVVHCGIRRENRVPLLENVVVSVHVQVLAEAVPDDQILNLDPVRSAVRLAISGPSP